MLIEIHMIQNHSPSNLNRDDLGAPKTCYFGGVHRARISSQCLKRSIRNPGNPEDVHKREPGLFARAMKGHIGTKTKFFPWLVKQALVDSSIPQEEHQRIVLATRLIAARKEKEKKKSAVGVETDPRPKTAQLIHLGPGHAKYYVEKLAELRQKDEYKKQYEYFLNPVAGFQEMVREHLLDSGLDEKEQEKIVKACWVIAKCRMSQLIQVPAGEEQEPELEMVDGQPDLEHARLIAERLTELRLSDPDRFNALTKSKLDKDEQNKIKETAPKKPKMDNFMEELKMTNRYDAVDIALFGRMTTSDAFGDVEAAMQVAHAISTHGVVNEVDYFTGLDDLGRAGGGAGHVDEAMFNSACFYKYFCLDWNQLVYNLAGPEPDKAKEAEAHQKWEGEFKPQAEKLAAATVGHFLRAAALTTPSGKQNSFAANNGPSGILVEIKNTKTPTSYANAFVAPVKRIGDPPDDAPDCVSLVGRSIAQLGDYIYNLRQAHDIDSTLLWYAMPLYRYPLQGWRREEDGRKKQENGKESTPISLTKWDDSRPTSNAKQAKNHRSFARLGGQEGALKGLVEAVVSELGFDWSQIKDSGESVDKEA